MRKIYIFLLFMFFYSIGNTQNMNNQIFYYYKSNKIFFQPSYEQVTVGVTTENYTEAIRLSIANICKINETAVTYSTIKNQYLIKFSAQEKSLAIAATEALKSKSEFLFTFNGYYSADGKTCTYSDEFVVKLKPSTPYSALEGLLNEYKCSLLQPYKFDNSTFILKANSELNFNGLNAANKFFETGLFEFSEPNFILHNGLHYTPNDPLYNLQWSIKNTGSAEQYLGTAGSDMNVENAWNITMGNPNLKIAVIDEGVDLTHPDLAANLLQGFDCLTQTSNIGDGKNLGTARAHGTACAGIIAARTDTNQNATNIGITGIAPFCKIIPINVSSATGTFTTAANIAGGFDYAWQNGADIISNSWGGSSPSSAMEDAIFRAVSLGRNGKGSVILFSSGNGNTSVSYPATNPYVIAVGASSMCDQRKSTTSCDAETFWGSNYGNTLDVVAPGVKIATTDLQGTSGYNTQAGTAGDFALTFNGTSSACPNAAGVAALILSVNSNYTYLQVKQILELSATKLNGYSYSIVTNQPNGTWNSETGHGRVNAYNAVLLAQSGIICNVEIAANGTTRFCSGGSVELAVKNPVIGTTYQWKKNGVNVAIGNSFTANSTGTYTVEATFANTCVAQSNSIAVTELTNSTPLIARAGTDKVICSGTGVFLGDTTVASGGSPMLADKRIFGMNWFNNAFVKFSADSPEKFDTIAINMLPLSEFNASQFYTGGTFTPYGYYVITTGSNKLIKVDTATGTQTLIGTIPLSSGSWSGLSWDRTTKKLYGLGQFSSNCRLYTINIFNASIENSVLIPLTRIYAIAFDKNGRLFATRSDNSSSTFDPIYEINKVTGLATPLSNNLGVSIEFQQDADYDFVTDKLYLTALTNFQRNGSPLIEVNTNTGAGTIIGQMGGFSEIDATAIADNQYTYSWTPSLGLNDTTVSSPFATPTTNTTYKLTVTDMCGNTSTDSVVVSLVETGTWRGLTSTSWHEPSNWCGGVPTATSNVIIPAGLTNYPTVTSGTYQIKNITIQNGATLNLNSGCTLRVSENMQNNGSIVGLGTLSLNGLAPQTISGIGNYNSLSLNNSTGISIQNNATKVNIWGTLQVNGLSTLTTNGNLVLKSNSLGTARIPNANNLGGYIFGNVEVERYIQGGFRKFRFLGHPFSSNLPISDISDEIDITGNISGTNANGFTLTQSSAPSSFTFSESLDDGNFAGWQAIASGNTPTQINPGEGLRVLVRGSKGQAGSLTGGSYTPDTVVLKMTGVLRQGDFTQNISFTDINKGWNLISNPYPSNIDWNNVTKNNVNNAVYTYRPSFNGGVYASFINNSSTNGGSNIIEAHSAFFVRTNAANASLEFHETDKTSLTQPNTMFRNATAMHSKIRLSLNKKNVQEEDEIVLRFGIDEASDLFDKKFDAENINGGLADLFALDATEKRYSIFHGAELNPFEKYREVKLGFTVLNTGEHTINASVLNQFMHGYKAYLKDYYLNQIIEINDSLQYNFNITQSGNINNRFSIVFSNQSAPKPITKADIFVTPNPTTLNFEVYYVALNNSIATNILVKDITGRTLQNNALGKVTNGYIKLNGTLLKSGIYLVELQNGNTRLVQKLVKL